MIEVEALINGPNNNLITSNKNIFFIILTLLVIIINFLIVFIVTERFNANPPDAFIARVKRSMVKSDSIGITDMKVVKEYSFDRKHTSPHASFDNWDTDDNVLGQFCKFGFKLIEYYGYHEAPSKYIKIVEDIVLRIDRALARTQLLPYAASDKNDSMKKRKYPWGGNWYSFSVYIPRLMVMYQCIGSNECIKQYVCHRNICKLITTINKSLNIKRSGVNMVYIGLPRLITNYMFDKETYHQEIVSAEFKELCDVYNITFNNSDSLGDGMYEDGSYIYHGKVATYSYLFTLHDFYENVFHTFNQKYNLRDIIKPVLEKLLHPTIPYVTLGLYGRDGNRRKFNWWNIQGKLGIAIIPSIGLGLFKTERFMFSLRVQRPHIAAYEADKSSKGEFALGWIQLRKMYLTDRNYSNPVTWEILKNEPGIMSIVSQATYTPLIPTDNVKQYMCDNVDSYIGRLIEPELMFWRNQYKFSPIYNCHIVEMGVATNNGFEIYYYIDNRAENRTLHFRVADNDIKDTDNIKIYGEGKKSINGFITIESFKITQFTWRLLFNSDEKTIIDEFDSTNSNMVFYYQTKKYIVNPLNNKEYFTVSCYNEGNNKLLYTIGGSSVSKLQDVMHYDDTEFVRDPHTCMYFNHSGV